MAVLCNRKRKDIFFFFQAGLRRAGSGWSHGEGNERETEGQNRTKLWPWIQLGGAQVFASLPLKYLYRPSWPPKPELPNAFQNGTWELKKQKKQNLNKTQWTDYFPKIFNKHKYRTCYAVDSLQHTKLSCGNSNCTVAEWTEEHSAAWAEPWTCRAPNQHQGCGARRALSIDYPSPISLILSFQQLKHFADII